MPVKASRKGRGLLGVGIYAFFVGVAMIVGAFVWGRTDSAFLVLLLLGLLAMFLGGALVVLSLGMIGSARWLVVAGSLLLALDAAGFGLLGLLAGVSPPQSGGPPGSEMPVASVAFGSLLILAFLGASFSFVLMGLSLPNLFRNPSTRPAAGRAVRLGLIGAALMSVLMVARGPDWWKQSPYGVDVVVLLAVTAVGAGIFALSLRGRKAY